MPVAISTTRVPASEPFAVPDPGGAPVGVESLAGIDQVREFGPTRRRSDKLTHLCSAKLTHRFTAGDAASSFQVVERFAFGATDRKGACGLATYARALSTSFQSCREGRRRLTPGCRAIIARAMLSPTGSASK